MENLNFCGNPVLSVNLYPIRVGISPRISCFERDVVTIGNTSSIILKIEEKTRYLRLVKEHSKYSSLTLCTSHIKTCSITDTAIGCRLYTVQMISSYNASSSSGFGSGSRSECNLSLSAWMFPRNSYSYVQFPHKITEYQDARSSITSTSAEKSAVDIIGNIQIQVCI